MRLTEICTTEEGSTLQPKHVLLAYAFFNYVITRKDNLIYVIFLILLLQ